MSTFRTLLSLRNSISFFINSFYILNFSHLIHLTVNIWYGPLVNKLMMLNWFSDFSIFIGTLHHVYVHSNICLNHTYTSRELANPKTKNYLMSQNNLCKLLFFCCISHLKLLTENNLSKYFTWTSLYIKIHAFLLSNSQILVTLFEHKRKMFARGVWHWLLNLTKFN